MPIKPNAVVTAHKISVRDKPDSTGKLITSFYKGDEIEVISGLKDKYTKVKILIEAEAYAYSEGGQYIKLMNDPAVISPEVRAFLDIVSGCVGGKYIYGAQGTKVTEACVRAGQKSKPSYYTGGRFEFLLALGKKCDAAKKWAYPEDYSWDCSGLFWYAMAKLGYIKNSNGVVVKDATAHGTYHEYCVPITKGELRPGDCVFYKNSSGRITHMGIVGEGGVIYEAASGYTGVVKLASVDVRKIPRIVGSGSLTKSAWNVYGRPKCFVGRAA
jgi:hypothetical protein